MKKLLLLSVFTMMFASGCNWGNDKCSCGCNAGCCDSGECTEACGCAACKDA